MLNSEADFDLLDRYATGGDPDAFGEIVRRYTAMVYHTCLRVLHDKALAEDAAQDTFYRLMCSPGSVNRSLGAWLHRTATHRSLDVLRSDTARAKRERVYSCEYYQGRANPPSWSVLSPQIDEALAKLPEPTRQLLVGHFLAGKTQRQLAQETRSSAATVSRRIKQGLMELREHLKASGLVVGAAALTSMLASQTALAAPPTVCAELGKMAMVSGDPAAMGTGGPTIAGVATKAGVAAAGVVVVCVVMFGLIQFGDAPATIIPPAPLTEPVHTISPSGSASIDEQAQSDARVAAGLYVFPNEGGSLDSQRITTLRISDPHSDTMSVGFADGHAETMRRDDVDAHLRTHTGQSLDRWLRSLPRTELADD